MYEEDLLDASEMTHAEFVEGYRDGQARLCGECGRPFQPRNWNQKYCSDECVDAADARRQNSYCGGPRLKIYDRDGFKCIYCGRSPVEHGVTLNLDHIIPVAKGGDNTAGNLVTACWQCNQEKGARRLKSTRFIRAEVSKRNKRVGLCDEAIINVGDRTGP